MVVGGEAAPERHAWPSAPAAGPARSAGGPAPWSTTVLYPVGAAWTRSRPVSTACTASAATSWVGTCAVAYDDVLVGTIKELGPGPDRRAAAVGVEDLEGDEGAQRAGRCAQEARCRDPGRHRSGPRTGWRGARRRSGTGRTHRRGPGAPSRRCRRSGRPGPRPRSRCGSVGRCRRLGDAGDQGRVQAAGHLRHWPAWADPRSGPAREMTSSGHSTTAEEPRVRGRRGRGPHLRGEDRGRDPPAPCRPRVARRPGRGHRDGAHRRTAVGGDHRDDEHEQSGGAPHGEQGRSAPDQGGPRAVRGRPDRAGRPLTTVATPTPPAHTPAVSRSGPPSRASCRRGPSAWPRKTPPSGSPPKGQVIRTASARVPAATNAGARPRQGGVRTAAAAKKRASSAMRSTAPYQLKARTQISPGP